MPFGNFHNESGAGWSVYWRIPKFNGSGLEIWWADFQGHRVMWRGSAPFAIVPYHHPDTGGEPPPPHFCYKDGIDTQCGGASFRALQHGAPNSGDPWHNMAFNAADDTDAVVVTVAPADDFNPARLTITAKFQCGWYQYVHSWEFDSYGAIHPRVAMGGMLNPFPLGAPTYKAHIHNFRIKRTSTTFTSGSISTSTANFHTTSAKSLTTTVSTTRAVTNGTWFPSRRNCRRTRLPRENGACAAPPARTGLENSRATKLKCLNWQGTISSRP